MPRDVNVCVGVVCVSHAKLSPFWLSLYPFAFLFFLCKINNSGLQRQRVEGENIHGKKNYRVMRPLSLYRSVYCLSRSTIAAFPFWWCVKPGGAASHTQTHAHNTNQPSSVVCSPSWRLSWLHLHFALKCLAHKQDPLLALACNKDDRLVYILLKYWCIPQRCFTTQNNTRPEKKSTLGASAFWYWN